MQASPNVASLFSRPKPFFVGHEWTNRIGKFRREEIVSVVVASFPRTNGQFRLFHGEQRRDALQFIEECQIGLHSGGGWRDAQHQFNSRRVGAGSDPHLTAFAGIPTP